jgi:pimeloyl-ACP methyl ester carboxylesterase
MMGPFYRATLEPDPGGDARIRWRPKLFQFFFGPNGEARRFDFRPALADVKSPALIVSGAEDVIVPPLLQDELAASFPKGAARLIRLPHKGAFPDADRLAALRVGGARFHGPCYCLRPSTGLMSRLAAGRVKLSADHD